VTPPAAEKRRESGDDSPRCPKGAFHDHNAEKSERPPAEGGDELPGSDLEDVERGAETERGSRSEEVERAQVREDEAQEG
jgi:hypothetical protein